MAGKGSQDRVSDKKTFNDNYEDIFGKKEEPKSVMMQDWMTVDEATDKITKKDK